MKKSKRLASISTVLLAGTLAFGVGLTSCGQDNPTPTPTPTTQDWNYVVEDDSKMTLNLKSELLVEAQDATYFSPYIIDGFSEGGSPVLLSSGGDTLLTSGRTASLYAYHVPEGYTVKARVQDSTGKDVEGILASDGTITCPEVTEKTSFVITLYGVSPTATIDTGYDNEDGTAKLAHDVVKKTINLDVIPQDQLASNDVFGYSRLDVRERSEISASLEKYALKNGLTGISVSDNGGYVLYNPRVHSPLLDTDSYLPGYGFGTFMYGTITEPLAGETTDAYDYYYHSQTTPSQETGTVNYLNSDLASVSDLYSYMSASYYTTELNDDYTEYSYIGNLAREMPIPLNADENGVATKWRIPVWVGGDTTDESKGVMKDLVFRTSSQEFAKYDNTPIKLEDYLTPFKLLATGKVGWYRGNEQAGEKTANRRIKGFSNFYNGTAKVEKLPSNESFMENVGVSLDYETNSIVLEFDAGFDQDFAVYQIDSIWSSPISEEFITELGGGDAIKGAGLYGTSAAPRTPVDTSLSVGPYYLESYSSKNLITFKKNEKWHFKEDSLGRETYQIEGYHIKVNSALEQDELQSVLAWENNLVESCTVLDDVWEKYENDERRKTVLGNKQSKWTFNRMDKLLWDQFFGEGGSWQQKYNPNMDVTWDVKPISSNDNFFYGMNLAVDRLGYSENFHQNPSIDYQNPIAKVNPVTGELYNNSPEHKEAVASVYGNSFDDLSKTTSYGVTYMLRGIVEELNAGHYRLGTGSQPTKVTLGIGSIDEAFYRNRVQVIAQDWTTAFDTAIRGYKDANGNNPLVDEDGNAKIVFELETDYVPADTSQEELITKGMWCGKYDIQYAYLIDGNAYDTINNVDILMSDKMGGFELNFATDTTIPSSAVYYDGKYWSFNSLWAACNGGTVVDKDGFEITGLMAPNNEETTAVKNEDGSVSITFSVVGDPNFNLKVHTETAEYDTYGAYALALDNQGYAVSESAVSFVDNGDGTYTLTVPKVCALPGELAGAPAGTTYVEYYFYYEVIGEKATAYQETGSYVLF